MLIKSVRVLAGVKDGSGVKVTLRPGTEHPPEPGCYLVKVLYEEPYESEGYITTLLATPFGWNTHYAKTDKTFYMEHRFPDKNIEWWIEAEEVKV